MKEENIQGSAMAATGMVIGLFVLVGVVILILNLFQAKSWTLFYYSSDNPDMNFLVDKVKDLDSKEACVIIGSSYTESGGSYECALNCKFSEAYITEICEQTCDHGGCRE